MQSDLRERIAAELFNQDMEFRPLGQPDIGPWEEFDDDDKKDHWRLKADRILAILSPGDAPAVECVPVSCPQGCGITMVLAYDNLICSKCYFAVPAGSPKGSPGGAA